MVPTDLPGDLPSFLERFGIDAQCRAYLFEARWPDGLSLRRLRPRPGVGAQGAADLRMHRLRQAALAAGRDHLRADQDRAARWFLAIFLVTSSKGGISAMELKRQMGFGSYQTAWSWLHKIRRAMCGGSPARAALPPVLTTAEVERQVWGGR